jgi:16S rRNA (guanine527-N7)-methyltransferase
MTEQEFIKYVKELRIDISQDQMDKLNKYYELLIEWNKVMDLTSITEKEQVYLKHFYDSLTLIKVIDLNNNLSLCDVGTGAGFPGIVLNIIFPKLTITLVDSQNKRVKFLDNVIKTLDLTNITTANDRAELYARSHLEEYDVVTARAVSKLNILNELCIPLLKVGGSFIAMKGNALEEIESSSSSLKRLSSKIISCKNFLLPIENSSRTLIKIEKEQRTNNKYPRDFKEIKKKPL